MNKWLLTLSISFALSTGIAQAAGNAAAGKEKATTLGCVACHGEDGNSLNPIWPKLAGQHQTYLAKQIGAFKAGERKDDAMSAMAMMVATDEDLADLSAFYASQALRPGETAPEMRIEGERIFRAGIAATNVPACSGCHGPQGLGNAPARFPRVAGQHADYTAKAMKDFRAGARASDPNQMMRGVAARMTDAEIAAVAQYMQGLK
jgi:cytochrome c553